MANLLQFFCTSWKMFMLEENFRLNPPSRSIHSFLVKISWKDILTSILWSIGNPYTAIRKLLLNLPQPSLWVIYHALQVYKKVGQTLFWTLRTYCTCNMQHPFFRWWSKKLNLVTHCIQVNLVHTNARSFHPPKLFKHWKNSKIPDFLVFFRNRKSQSNYFFLPTARKSATRDFCMVTLWLRKDLSKELSTNGRNELRIRCLYSAYLGLETITPSVS